MLSRVIGHREGGNVNAQPFMPAPLVRTHAAPPGWSGISGDEVPGSASSQQFAEDYARLAAQNQALTSTVRTLEAQLASTKSEAFDAGLRQGEQFAQLELAPIVEKMKQSISETATARRDARHRAEGDVVDLALRIAKRVLHREVTTDPTSLSALAKVVFERMARAESYTLTIHPQFLTAVQSVLSGAQTNRVRIEPDSNCAPGTFVIKSAEGTIDASIETQLEEISRGLADRLAQD